MQRIWTGAGNEHGRGKQQKNFDLVGIRKKNQSKKIGIKNELKEKLGRNGMNLISILPYKRIERNCCIVKG